MAATTTIFAPGTRIIVRDAEWLVRRVDRTSTGGQALDVVGISELVRDKNAIFLTEVDKNIEVLDPAETKLTPDTSSSYQASFLYMESLLRKTTPTDNDLYCGYKAAMDLVPYQLEPGIQALNQPRQRILISDAVGLGKTLEAGILISELIRRGRGKRILVVAVKSMLTQFQKELWNRFTIPLTRLDSIGIKRVRANIPTNHNPFYYYDRSIISVDTLKQSREYQVYLENAYWDIIVIDEAQNVAERGDKSSQRAKLAKLLSDRSDTLIMLSATPHDGRARSFASLMNMLDPTAIADPDNYGPDDIRGLFIRRFKKDIQDQVKGSFKEREIKRIPFAATQTEEDAFDAFVDTKFTRIDQRAKAGELFKTTLEKALFSSPTACLKSIHNRIQKTKKQNDPSFDNDIAALNSLAEKVSAITPQHFSKYQKLLHVIGDPFEGFGWTGKDTQDRLMIFTERIDTLDFLYDHLKKDLKLNEKQIEKLHGTLPDDVQQRIVEDFGKDESPIRLLVASDVASEGINLHFLSHRMIHFDIPWSLMVFQQRNGRIDRYGQEQTPQIRYLITRSNNEKIKGDMRILELLIDKDEQAHKNIGDPLSLMGVYDELEEERLTAEAIEKNQTPEEFTSVLEDELNDPLAILLGQISSPTGEDAGQHTRRMPSLYPDDFAYLQAALKHIRDQNKLQVEFLESKQQIELTATEDLSHRFRFFPKEVQPEDGCFILSADRDAIKKEIRRCRKDEHAWPRINYLWELNPVVEWANDKVLAAFGRHEAPVLSLLSGMDPGETIFIISGLIPNRKGHPLIHQWFGVSYLNGKFQKTEEFDTVVKRLGLDKKSFPNRGVEVDVADLRTLLPDAINRTKQAISEKRNEFERVNNDKLQDQYSRLEALRKRQYTQMEIEFDGATDGVTGERKQTKKREIDRIFAEFFDWIQETMTTEDTPYIKVVAVLRAED